MVSEEDHKIRQDIFTDDQLNEDKDYGLPPLKFSVLDEIIPPNKSTNTETDKVVIKSKGTKKDANLSGISKESNLTNINNPKMKITENKNFKLILSVVLGIVLVTVIVLYVLSRSNVDVPVKEEIKVKIESPVTKQPEKRKEVIKEVEFVKEEPLSPNQNGSVNIIKSAQSKFYVISGSFVDYDLAIDYANDLAERGVNATVIAPESNWLTRVAIAELSTQENLEIELNKLKQNFGNEIWGLSY
ncbi:MAG: SPOR domain-containing protein [Flammeovirgaceae bacterium]|jgi:cell division septation protein DedD|nr:SPOR domain-containing protein [Flammeovirgaceae bacterium]|tara:strand:+ start:29236 stop:29967 length:732 start_codon:yes stop_codon:yes gene_type:complete